MYNTDSESRTVANVCRCRPIRTKSRQNEMSNITYPPEKFPRKKIQEIPPSADSAPARAPAGVMGPAPLGKFWPTFCEFIIQYRRAHVFKCFIQSSENQMNTVKYCTVRRPKAKKAFSFWWLLPLDPLSYQGLCK